MLLLLVVVGAKGEAGASCGLLGLRAKGEARRRRLLLLGLLAKEAACLRLVLLLAEETAAGGGSPKSGSGGLGTKETARLLLLLLWLAEKTAGGGGASTEAGGRLLSLTESAASVVAGAKAKAGGRGTGSTRAGVALGSALLIVHEAELLDAVVAVGGHDGDGLVHVPGLAILDVFGGREVLAERVVGDRGGALGDLTGGHASSRLAKGAGGGTKPTCSGLLLLLLAKETASGRSGCAKGGGAKAACCWLLLLLLCRCGAEGEGAGGVVVGGGAEAAEAGVTSGSCAERTTSSGIVRRGAKAAKGGSLGLVLLLAKETAAGLCSRLRCAESAGRTKAWM